MSTFEQPQAQDIRHPVFQEPDAVVEFIYPETGTTDAPDLESQDTMSEFLYERFAPDKGPNTRIVLTPTRRTLPGIERIADGYKEVGHWRIKPNQWVISRKLAAIVAVGSVAVFNGIGNRSTITGAAEYAGHEIYRVFNPVTNRVVAERRAIRTPGRETTITETADTGDQVDSTVVEPSVVRMFVENINQTREHGGQVVKISIIGNTSDEWGGDSSIGVVSPDNNALGKARAEAAIKELESDGFRTRPSDLQVSQIEHVISPEEKAELLTEVKTDGYHSISAAIEAVDDNQAVPTSLSQKIKQFFTGKQDRGVTLSAIIKYPGKEKVSTEAMKITIPGKDHKPHVPEPGFFGFIPLLPIRRRERYTSIEERHRWQITPSKQLYRPQIIREDIDQAWLRIRPEAKNEDGTLIDHAWAFTRKYEHLFRDKRIVDVIRADFKNTAGEEKSLRVIFVDRSPAQETVDLFESLLKKYAAMDGGVLGDRVSGIFVYPSESAGTDHGDPKLIALGIDKQSSENILGTFTYPLKLIELHMRTTTWSKEELEAMFKQMSGPAFVTSHEIGHGVDQDESVVQTLRPVKVRGIPNAHIIDGDVRGYKMTPLYPVLRKLPRKNDRKSVPIEYDIEYPVLDRNSQLTTMYARVDEYDPRLRHATVSTIVDHQPTRYGSTNASESFAEHAASVTTGIEIPYSEAGTKVSILQTDKGVEADFARGYRPDAHGQQLFTNAVNAQRGTFPASFANPPEVKITHTHPVNDPLLRQQFARTSWLRSPRPEDLIAILARVTRRDRG